MITMTIACFVLLLLVCSWPASEAAAPQANKTYDASTFPSPMLKPAECGMGQNKSFVCDPDKILQPLQATQLNDLITSKSRGFRCTCKDNCVNYSDRYVMMVAIVKRVNVAKGASIEEQKLAVDQFAKDLQARGWAGGNCNNDIVIVLCTEYKMIVTSVGSETNNVLTDSCVGNLTHAVSRLLERDRYFAVVQELVFKYSKYLNLTFCAADDTLSRDPAVHPVMLYVILAVLGAIGLTLSVWILRICITTCKNSWKKKRRLHLENSDMHEFTELTAMTCPVRGGDGNGDNENQQRNSDLSIEGGSVAKSSPKAGTAKSLSKTGTPKSSPKTGTAKSLPETGTAKSLPKTGTAKTSPREETSKRSPRTGTSTSSPRTGTSREGACGYTPRGNFNSLRDGRPHLYLDVSKC